MLQRFTTTPRYSRPYRPQRPGKTPPAPGFCWRKRHPEHHGRHLEDQGSPPKWLNRRQSPAVRRTTAVLPTPASRQIHARCHESARPLSLQHSRPQKSHLVLRLFSISVLPDTGDLQNPFAVVADYGKSFATPSTSSLAARSPSTPSTLADSSTLPSSIASTYPQLHRQPGHRPHDQDQRFSTTPSPSTPP